MIQKPAGIEYNHLTRKVIWGDTGDYLLQQANLDGTGYEVLVDVGMYKAHPGRVAIDYSTGNLFYTAVRTDVTGFSGVAVVTPNGIHKKIVEYGKNPRAIALDPELGVMFWTDFGTTPAVLMRANMDGSDMVPVYDKMVWPNGIAINTKVKTVFVTDGHESSNRIYACTFSGSCSVFHEDPGAHLMDIKLLDDYLFYSTWNKVYITRIDIHTKEVVKFAENAELGRLDAIAVYNSSLSEPVSGSCSPNNGRADCSTLCLSNVSGYTCACADGVSLLQDRKTCSDVTTTTTKTTSTTKTSSITTVPTTTTTTTTNTSRTTTSSAQRSSTIVQGSPNDATKGASLVPYIGGGGAGVVLVLIVAIIIACYVRKRRQAGEGPRYLSDNERIAVYQGNNVDIRRPEREGYETPLSIAQIRARENQAYQSRQSYDYLHFPQLDDAIPPDFAPPPPYEANRTDPPLTLPKPHFLNLQSTKEIGAVPDISRLPAVGSVHTTSVQPSEARDILVGSVRREVPGRRP